MRIKGGRTELNIKSEELEDRQGKHGGTIFEALIMKTLLKGVSHLWSNINSYIITILHVPLNAT